MKSQLNGCNGEATNSDDVKRGAARKQSNRDINQDRKIAALTNKINALSVSLKKKNSLQNKKPTKKVHTSHLGLLRSDHGTPTCGLMDSTPTAPVTLKAQSAAAPTANQYFLGAYWPGGCNEQSVTASTAPGDGQTACKVIDTWGFSSKWDSGSTVKMREMTTSAATGAAAFAKAASPYAMTDTMKSKCNKISLHLSYSGTQTNMTSEVYIYVDYHGDLFGTAAPDSATSSFWASSADTVIGTIMRHPKVIRIKVESGKSVDYCVPFPTAQLVNSAIVSSINSFRNSTDGLATTSVNISPSIYLPNFECDIDNGSEYPYVIRFNDASASELYVVRNPQIYVVAACQTACQLNATILCDNEYADESIISVSKPSPMDVGAAHALHAVVQAAHFEAHRTPLHTDGIKWKNMLQKVRKAEHVAASFAASPTGEAIMAAALA